MPCRGTGLTGAQDSVGAGHDGCGRPRTCSADRHLPRRSCSVYPSALHLRWTHPEHCIRALAVAEEPWPFWAGEGEPSGSTGGGRQSAGGRKWGTAAPVGRLNGSGEAMSARYDPSSPAPTGFPCTNCPIALPLISSSGAPSPRAPACSRSSCPAAALLDPRAGARGTWGCAPCGRRSLTGRTVGSCLRCAVAPSLPSTVTPSEGAIVPPGPGRGTREALVSHLTRASPCGVSDGARTRDTQDHNLVLYQLSYTHHVSRTAARRRVVRGTGTTIPETLRRPMRPGVPARARRRPRPRTAPRRTP